MKTYIHVEEKPKEFKEEKDLKTDSSKPTDDRTCSRKFSFSRLTVAQSPY